MSGFDRLLRRWDLEITQKTFHGRLRDDLARRELPERHLRPWSSKGLRDGDGSSSAGLPDNAGSSVLPDPTVHGVDRYALDNVAACPLVRAESAAADGPASPGADQLIAGDFAAGSPSRL